MKRFIFLLLLLITYNFCTGQQIIEQKNEDGTISKGMVDNNGERVGAWKKLYSSGTVFIAMNYVNGKLDGQVTSYYKNGKVQAINDYIEGKLNGVSQQFDIKGDRIREISYKDNLIYGNCIYYEDGVIDNERYYKNGVIDGPCKDYREGNLKMEYTMLPSGEIIDQICYSTKTGKKINCNFF